MAPAKSRRVNRSPVGEPGEEETITQAREIAENVARALRLFGTGTTQDILGSPDAPS